MKNVKVYSTPTCSFCTRVKQYLDEKGVAYETIDVAADPKAGEDMVAKSGQMGVPVLDIEGEIVIGFDKDKINTALGL